MATDTKRPLAPGQRGHPAETQPAEPLKRTAKGTFAQGNVGRRTGTQRKATVEATAWALPLVPEVLKRRLAHRRSCPAAKDCAMCRHYNDMVMHYAYGKPPQRQELVLSGMKADAAQLVKELGGTESEAKAAVDEVERRYKALRAAQ